MRTAAMFFGQEEAFIEADTKVLARGAFRHDP
jgi:hypothetical protein